MAREIVARADVSKAQPTVRSMGTPAPPAEGGGAPSTRAAEVTTPPTPATDDYIQRLLKYVPTEVIGVYLLVQSLAASLGDETLRTIVTWGLFVLGIVATWFYLQLGQKVTKRTQLIFSAGAFAAWVLGTNSGGPFSMLGLPPALGTIIMVVYTAGISLVEPQS